MMMYVRFVVQTPPSLIPNTAKILDSGCESIIRTFLGAAGSYSSSASLLSKVIIKNGKEKRRIR